MRDWKRLAAIAAVCALVGLILGAVLWYVQKHGGINPSGRKPAASPQTQSTYNALFNKGDNFGLWIYKARGNCPSLRELDRAPLVVIASASYAGEGRLQVAELERCFQLDLSKPEEPVITNCTEGFVELNATKDSERAGAYSFTLTNGQRLEGELRATYCAAAK